MCSIPPAFAGAQIHPIAVLQQPYFSRKCVNDVTLFDISVTIEAIYSSTFDYNNQAPDNSATTQRYNSHLLYLII